MRFFLWIWWLVVLRSTTGTSRLSDWMANLPMELMDFKLTEIAIPGSHDSAAYSITADSEIFLQELQHENNALSKYFINEVSGNFSPVLKEIVYRWSKTQDLNITEQLELGIRYLDLRVAYNDEMSRLEIVHGLLGTTLTNILEQVALFTALHPKEIILLDFNHIYVRKPTQFITAQETILYQLRRILKTSLCSLQQSAKSIYRIIDIWEMKCQVVVILANNENKKRSQISIKSPYSYTKFIQKSPWLHFLDINYKKRREPDTFYVTQGIMQPHWMEVIAAGLSEKATLKEWVSKEATNEIVDWLRDKRIGRTHGVNIVIADFVEFQNFTEKVVDLNFSYSPSSSSKLFGSVHQALTIMMLLSVRFVM